MAQARSAPQRLRAAAPAPPPVPVVQRAVAPPPPRAGRVAQRAVATTPDPTGLPISQRPVVTCTMGQGVSAYLDKAVLYSSGFSTCTPIVLFNESKRYGGLFHFAAEDMKNQSKALWSFYSRVQPTAIYIGDRSVAPDSQHGHDVSQSDTEALVGLFTGMCGFKGKCEMLTVRAQQYYVTLGADDALWVTPDWPKASNVDIDFSKSKAPPIPPSASAANIRMVGQNLYEKK